MMLNLLFDKHTIQISPSSGLLCLHHQALLFPYSYLHCCQTLFIATNSSTLLTKILNHGEVLKDHCQCFLNALFPKIPYSSFAFKMAINSIVCLPLITHHHIKLGFLIIFGMNEPHLKSRRIFMKLLAVRSDDQGESESLKNLLHILSPVYIERRSAVCKPHQLLPKRKQQHIEHIS